MRRLRCRWPFEPWDCTGCGDPVEKRPPTSVLAGLVCDTCLDAGRKGEPFIPLTIRPVKTPKPDERPIIAVDTRTETCALESGEAFDLAGLVDRIRERKPGERGRAGRIRTNLPGRLPAGIIATNNGLDLLAYLDQSPASASPFWQWQVSVRSSTAWRPEAGAELRRQFLFARPVRFGYASRRDGRQRAKGKSLWWLMLDPHQFVELPDGWGSLDVVELLRFGIELRQWSIRQQVPVLQSASAYGSRFLRDDRFGAGWRRKVPSSTNKRMRRRLPGNHYQLLGRRNATYPTAHKWDQEAAHHSAALITRFPHSDELQPRGWYRREPPPAGAPFTDRTGIRVGTDRHRELLAQPGMFTIAVSVPERVAIDNLQLPQLRKAGRHWQTFTSVEIDHVRRLRPDGVRLLDIWCAWTSPSDDDRLREYAMWSGAQLAAASSSQRRWLKPLLLATYGMLAVRPSRFRSGFRWCKRPDGAVGWPTRYGTLVGLERSGRHEREPQATNVLWRALIESRVRLESLTFARELRLAGVRPIAVYADGVFATSSHPIDAVTRSPWRYEGIVHDLIFESPGRYRSREETRLPGSPRGRGGLQRALPKPTAERR